MTFPLSISISKTSYVPFKCSVTSEGVTRLGMRINDRKTQKNQKVQSEGVPSAQHVDLYTPRKRYTAQRCCRSIAALESGQASQGDIHPVNSAKIV